MNIEFSVKVDAYDDLSVTVYDVMNADNIDTFLHEVKHGLYGLYGDIDRIKVSDRVSDHIAAFKVVDINLDWENHKITGTAQILDSKEGKRMKYAYEMKYDNLIEFRIRFINRHHSLFLTRIDAVLLGKEY